MAVAGWRGGQHGLYRADLAKLDPKTIRQIRDELAQHQREGVTTNREGAQEILKGWSARKEGDPATLQFMIKAFGEIYQINLTGMIGFCEQLLYDMSLR